MEQIIDVNPQKQQPASILVIDDDEMVRFTLRTKLVRFGYIVTAVEKAEDALYIIKNGNQHVDFIITDIKLRKMDGVELLRYVSSLETPIPVLLTGQGNVEDAIKALRYGACDFLRKPLDINEVASVIRSVLKIKQQESLAVNFGKFAVYEKRNFLLPSDINVINIITIELTKHLVGIGICNQSAADNVSLALREALNNAMFHGNLDVNSDLRETMGMKVYFEEIEKRRQEDQYKNRRVKISYELTKDFVEYIIEDEGKGFDYQNIPDPSDIDNFLKKSGRGIFIIKGHMDEVEWYGNGNIIRIKKYKTVME